MSAKGPFQLRHVGLGGCLMSITIDTLTIFTRGKPTLIFWKIRDRVLNYLLRTSQENWHALLYSAGEGFYAVARS